VSARQTAVDALRIGYADPPYPGQSEKHYKDHPDYAGEVNHHSLIQALEHMCDGWVLHTHVPGLRLMEREGWLPEDVRIAAWCKPFAAFKRNVPVAYAWEPVIVRAARKPRVGGLVKPLRDFIMEPITLKRGLAGAKPEKVCWWAFEMAGCRPEDQLVDMYPGTGAVTRAWESWCSTMPQDAMEVAA